MRRLLTASAASRSSPCCAPYIAAAPAGKPTAKVTATYASPHRVPVWAAHPASLAAPTQNPAEEHQHRYQQQEGEALHQPTGERAGDVALHVRLGDAVGAVGEQRRHLQRERDRDQDDMSNGKQACHPPQLSGDRAHRCASSARDQMTRFCGTAQPSASGRLPPRPGRTPGSRKRAVSPTVRSGQGGGRAWTGVENLAAPSHGRSSPGPLALRPPRRAETWRSNCCIPPPVGASGDRI